MKPKKLSIKRKKYLNILFKGEESGKFKNLGGPYLHLDD
jgi:hypothetical protein